MKRLVDAQAGLPPRESLQTTVVFSENFTVVEDDVDQVEEGGGKWLFVVDFYCGLCLIIS